MDKQFVKRPMCHYGGGKSGHYYQLNPQNENDLICSCGYAWKIPDRRTKN